jgi:flagellar M-ring protein FliF
MSLEKVSGQLSTIVKGLSAGKKASLILVILSSIIGFVMIITWAGVPDYQGLYSNLNPEDAGSIIAYLKENRIPYKISETGNGILVPKENIYEIRMSLASKGLPQGSGVGFEIFDNTKIGISEFTQNINYQRALQGELSRTINRFEEIESSRVHIVLLKNSLFKEDEEPATASVVVKLRQGRNLSGNKVQSIVHLLSSSISGLQPENVTVVDSNGNMLTHAKSSESEENSSDDQMQYQEKMEKNIETRIKSMLETALGPAKAIVRVSCLLDFKKQEKTEELYLPDNRVIRSEQRFNEMSKGEELKPAGIPGVEQNNNQIKADVPTDSKGYQKNDQTINYEIGHVTSHTIEPTGKIKRLSVAVLVDGSYKKNQNEKEEVSTEYIPRTKEEMEKLINIVKRSVNFDMERGDEVEVVNIPFENQKTSEIQEDNNESGWAAKISSYSSYLKFLFAGLFVLMTFMFVVRPIIAWLTTSPPGARHLIDHLPKTAGQIQNESHGNYKQLSYHEQVKEKLKSDSASVDLLNQWMNEA